MERSKMRGFFSIVHLLLCFTVILFITCKEEQCIHPTAIATFVSGNVTITYPGSASMPLNIKEKIIKGAVITAQAHSLATIQINGVGIMRIIENSSIEMKSILSDDGTVLHLNSGSVFSRVMKKPGMRYLVKTKTMVASVRGTEFLTVASDNKNQVLVREGTVAVTTSVDTAGKDVTVQKNAVVDTNGQVTLVDQNRIQQLTLEKYALHPYIENVDKKNPEEISREFHSVTVEEKMIDQEIEKIQLMQLSPLDRLRKQGKPLFKLFLKDGSQLIGAIEKSSETGVTLNTGENVIDIPKNDIRRRVTAK